jgi:protein involved in polysaccharide export with SLBB domain/capsular polysaccharide biosynthesis protein
MSEEYTHVGTVRRRPRTGHQRSESSTRNGRPASAANNGAAREERSAREEPRREFERESDYDREPGTQRRESRRPEDRGSRWRKEKKPRKALRSPSPSYGPELDEEPLFRFPFDPWRLFGAVKRNFIWILLAAGLLGTAGFFLAAMVVQPKVSVPLMRITSNAIRTENAPLDHFMPRDYSEQTLYSMMKSRDVLQRVSDKAANDPLLAPLNVTPEKLNSAVNIKPTPNPDQVVLTMEAFGGLRGMPELANLYAEEMITYMREFQRKEAISINAYLSNQLVLVNAEIGKLTAELMQFSGTGFIGFDAETTNRIAKLTRFKDELDQAKIEKVMIEARMPVSAGGIAIPATMLDQAIQERRDLLTQYSPKHPLVEMKDAQIKKLEALPDKGGPVQAVAASGNNFALTQAADLQGQLKGTESKIETLTKQIQELTNSLGGESFKGLQFEIKRQELASKQKARDKLAEREGQSSLYVSNSLGYFDVQSKATLGNVDHKRRWMKVSVLACMAALAGLFVAMGLVMLTEMLDTTLRTAEDISRVTGLPVLASLGDLKKMSPQQQVTWAFRTLTLLRGKLSRDADQALVCGIISANHGEGRSTWVNLLVSAASQRGLRVLTVDTRPTAGAPDSTEPQPEPFPKRETAPAAAHSEKKETVNGASGTNGHTINLPDQPTDALTTNVLSTPSKVTEQLEDPNAQPLVHIPLPGWVWNLERRKQWQKALDHWKDIDNLVIFVELPPASEQESMLLAEHLPQCLWLTGSGMADAAETKIHIETLRHGRCNLVGAVLNYAPPPFLNSKITRWFNRGAAALLLCASLTSGMAQLPNQAEPDEQQVEQRQISGVKARNLREGERPRQPRIQQVEDSEPQIQESEQLTPAQEQTLAFSANPKRKRAKWQERLTFGPGDVVDIHFYGLRGFDSALSRTNVFIGPDGRINYLQAAGVNAAGLTVEELREAINKEIAEFYPAARAIVMPVAFNSKKYFMLGKVNAKGAYPLDRPLTLLEAVGRAKGLETGLYQRTTVEMADLGRSFIVRDGQKLQVDFEKLFLEGDLSQNIAMEPNDYVFFASTGASDIYVLGEVMNPGPLGFVQSATVLTAIADRGGYSEKAFKRRVLVVRGSLREPETFVVDSGGVLDARHRDFRLQPRDIVYVSSRPWVKAEELLDEAAASFIQGAVTTWSGVNVGPIITKRLLPRASNKE